ncbi:MAG: CRISPR-associated helicase Cas3' [Syntrophomonadales bacterium]
MQNQFWAKSNGTSLTKHTNDVLQAVEILRHRKRNNIPEDWWLALKYAALLHDLGKIDPAFQEMLKRTGHDLSGRDVPHSFLSLFLFRPELLNFDNYIFAHTIVSAVAFHHWRESFPDLMMGYRTSDINAKAKEFVEENTEWSERCKRVAEQLREVANYYQLDGGIIGINETLIEYLRNGTLGAAGVLVPPYTMAFLPSNIRGGHDRTEQERFRIFVAGNLMRADHFASLVEDSNGGLEIKDIQQGDALSSNVIHGRIKSLINTNNYWQKEFFNTRPNLRRENMILVAPTGFGKTEFAYLWGAGINNLMLLPMRAATNKLFDRTQNLYGKDQVALLHGDASLELFVRSQQNNAQETEGERRKAIDLARHLAKPYIVATADQIAPSALRYPGYERIFSTLMDSALIIDEVQAYDPQSAAIVTHLIQQNSHLGGKTLLMTATLPPFIETEIVQRVKIADEQIVNVLKLPEYQGIATSVRHRIQFLTYNKGYESVIERVVDASASGKKVLVIMNTVPAACGIYDQINAELKRRSLQIKHALLHSRFTAQRRKELEALVVDNYMPNKPERDTSPCIVVSTQIVEASLDIDADVIFTEPAPADSLVQRMGRVNRRFARSQGINVSQNANVVIIVEGKVIESHTRKAKGNDNKDAPLGTGIGGKVYDRNLTAISLVVLANRFDSNSLEEASMPILDEQPWESCFLKRKGPKAKGINEALYKIIRQLENRSLLLTEQDKMEWVKQTYTLLQKSSDTEFPLNLGNYINRYKETLEILDHGYCSDKKRDAMKLFRDINDFAGIPEAFVANFYSEVYQWVKDTFPKLNYEVLATAILPKYLVQCPYHSASKENRTYYHELNLENVIPQGFSSDGQALIFSKLRRWLNGIVVLEFSYDPEKGLNYFEP